MRLARYVGNGQIAIVDEPIPQCPQGGLLVKTAACGLCSGELMDWYMDRKIPHVLGHEVSGEVVESQDERFPIGSSVFAHHHAPCLTCDRCRSGHFVHCPQWKSTKLVPGGMAEYFAVSRELLNDTWRTDSLRAIDAALIEPLACVQKSLRRGRWQPGEPVAIVGLGAMGLMHALICGSDAVGFEIAGSRIAWADELGIRVNQPGQFPVVIVCPGSAAAVQKGIELCDIGGRLVLFAPLPPASPLELDLEKLYFRDIELVTSYSCGPDDCRAALDSLRSDRVQAESVVSDFISLDELPRAYLQMKRGGILKAMVVF